MLRQGLHRRVEGSQGADVHGGCRRPCRRLTCLTCLTASDGLSRQWNLLGPCWECLRRPALEMDCQPLEAGHCWSVRNLEPCKWCLDEVLCLQIPIRYHPWIAGHFLECWSWRGNIRAHGNYFEDLSVIFSCFVTFEGQWLACKSVHTIRVVVKQWFAQTLANTSLPPCCLPLTGPRLGVLLWWVDIHRAPQPANSFLDQQPAIILSASVQTFLYLRSIMIYRINMNHMPVARHGWGAP